MKLTPLVRACTAGAAAALLVLTGVGTAQAEPLETATPSLPIVNSPTPSHGPDSGSTPVTISLPNGPKWVQVDPGRDNVVGLADDGLLYTWGAHTTGHVEQLPTPAGVTFTEISVATNVSTALSNDGTAYAWGTSPGDGTTEFVNAPTHVTLPDNEIAAGVTSGRNFVLVRTVSGAVYGWGQNGEGALGDGTLVSKYSPTRAHINPELFAPTSAQVVNTPSRLLSTPKVNMWCSVGATIPTPPSNTGNPIYEMSPRQ